MKLFLNYFKPPSPGLRPPSPSRGEGRGEGDLILHAFLFLCIFILASCGGGGGGGSSDNSENANPSSNAATSDDLASQVVNTFVDHSIDLTADPTYLDFGTTSQYTKIKKTVTISNNSGQSLTLNLSFYGTSGGFRIVDENGSFTAYKPDFMLAAGEAQSFTVQFDASILGLSRGYIEITDANGEDYLHIPFQGVVSSATDFLLISASDICSNSDAPQLTKLDFMRVASGRYKDKSFKICNTGRADITVNQIIFVDNTTGAVSASVNTDLIDDGFTLYDIEPTTSFVAPTIDYDPPDTESINQPAAFDVTEDESGDDPKNLVIPVGSFALFNVRYKPSYNHEAAEGEIYEALPYAADMTVETSSGNLNVDVVGSTGGKEPMLEVSYVPEGETLSKTLDLDSSAPALPFDVALIYEDFVPEDSKDMTVTLKNVGSGSKNLQVWVEPLESGYFTFVQTTPETTFPIELEPNGDPAAFKLRYAPNPSDGKAGDNYDMGQLIIQHTGGNGAENKITLYGEEEKGAAIEVYQESSKLKQNKSDGSSSYDSKPKSFCAVKIGDSVVKSFTIYNNSSRYPLTSTISVTSPLTDSEEAPLSATAKVSKSSLTINPGTASTFNMTLTAGTNVPIGETLHGILSIDNSYGSSTEAELGKQASDYDVHFSIMASDTGECTSGSGNPVDGDVVLVVDRITMILNGLETARNPPHFIMHLPVNMDKIHEAATIGALPYDPINTDPNSVGTFKPYNHQMANISGCFPLPTNPYRQERESGSWTGPAQCEYTSTLDSSITTDGTTVCLPPNKPELYTDADGTQYYVFYHEFIKFNPDDCTMPEIEGKIATFYLQKKSDGNWQSIKEVFTDMADQVGEDGTASQYQSFLHTFQFGSFMKFYKTYNKGGCNHAENETLDGATRSDEIAKCWDAFGADTTMRRASGMTEECTYFFFDVKPGCIPPDVPWKNEVAEEDFCTADQGSTYSDPDTWIGFGEYEPHIDLRTGEQDDEKWDFTFRNVHLEGSFIVNSLGPFFDNTAKLLFADLNATITTKAVGYDSNWDDLIAVDNRSSLTKDDVQVSFSNALDNWTNDGENSAFTTGPTGSGDDIPCFSDATKKNPAVEDGASCRGNFVINGSKINPAGEPVDFVNNNRFLVVGLGVFQGPLSRGQLAPSFAREVSGKGKALVFTLHGCLASEESVADNPDYGCYEGHIDNTDQYGNEIDGLLDDYHTAGILSDDDYNNAQSDDPEVQALSKAWINYRIFDQDRDRLTDYYNTNNFVFDTDWYTSTPCGYGM